MLLLGIRAIAAACSFSIGGDPVLARSFTLRFEQQDKPLAGVTVSVWPTTGKAIERIAGPDGTVRFVGIPAGMYSLSAGLPGIQVASSGFTVDTRSTQKSWVLQWTEPAVEVRKISGKLLWGEHPVRLAEMWLKSLASGKAVRVFTNDWGLFRFDAVREPGDYVLYSEGGDAPGSGPLMFGRSMLVRLNPSAKRGSMDVEMELTFCGGRMLVKGE